MSECKDNIYALYVSMLMYYKRGTFFTPRETSHSPWEKYPFTEGPVE